MEKKRKGNDEDEVSGITYFFVNTRKVVEKSKREGGGGKGGEG